MKNYSKTPRASRMLGVMFCVLTIAFWSPTSLAQHGHPLVGTWSGFLNPDEGPPLRALVTMSFSVDQVISGMLFVNGQRFPFTSAELDHENWTVTINAEGQDRGGKTLSWTLGGVIENLDSPTERTLSGTWQESGNTGDFSITIN